MARTGWGSGRLTRSERQQKQVIGAVVCVFFIGVAMVITGATDKTNNSGSSRESRVDTYNNAVENWVGNTTLGGLDAVKKTTLVVNGWTMAQLTKAIPIKGDSSGVDSAQHSYWSDSVSPANASGTTSLRLDFSASYDAGALPVVSTFFESYAREKTSTSAGVCKCPTRKINGRTITCTCTASEVASSCRGSWRSTTTMSCKRGQTCGYCTVTTYLQSVCLRLEQVSGGRWRIDPTSPACPSGTSYTTTQPQTSSIPLTVYSSEDPSMLGLSFSSGSSSSTGSNKRSVMIAVGVLICLGIGGAVVFVQRRRRTNARNDQGQQLQYPLQPMEQTTAQQSYPQQQYQQQAYPQQPVMHQQQPVGVQQQPMVQQQPYAQQPYPQQPGVQPYPAPAQHAHYSQNPQMMPTAQPPQGEYPQQPMQPNQPGVQPHPGYPMAQPAPAPHNGYDHQSPGGGASEPPQKCAAEFY